MVKRKEKRNAEKVFEEMIVELFQDQQNILATRSPINPKLHTDKQRTNRKTLT